jgi:hypothetical protein
LGGCWQAPSGKTRAIGTLAAYLAACIDYRSVLGPGERGVLPILACNVLQAAQCYNFIRGIFMNIPRFAALVEQLGGRHGGITSDTISLKNRIDIQVRPASFRTIRGITAIGIVAEECSMWQSDDSRNPDREILAAGRPCLATTGGTLFAIGSPHARKGETWTTYRKHYGPDGNPAILVANGPTKLFNPTIKQSVIDRAYEADPQVAASEWGGRFRDDLESYVSPEIVDACTSRGVHQVPFDPCLTYTAHTDPSGGGQDSFALSIGHVADGVGVLDLLLERRPSFPIGGPVAIVEEFCSALKAYGLYEVSGDKFAKGFTAESFRENGVEYREAGMTSSDYYAGFLPILNSGRVQLLDNKRLATQLCSLERRQSRIGAKDAIGHPFGGHDDVALVVAALFTRIVGGSGAPALIKYKDFLNSNGEPYTGDCAHYFPFMSLAVDATGRAAVLHWAGHRYLNPQLILADFEVGYFSDKRFAPWAHWLTLCFAACSATRVAGLVVGLYEPTERDIIRVIYQDYSLLVKLAMLTYDNHRRWRWVHGGRGKVPRLAFRVQDPLPPMPNRLNSLWSIMTSLTGPRLRRWPQSSEPMLPPPPVTTNDLPRMRASIDSIRKSTGSLPSRSATSISPKANASSAFC